MWKYLFSDELKALISSNLLPKVEFVDKEVNWTLLHVAAEQNCTEFANSPCK